MYHLLKTLKRQSLFVPGINELSLFYHLKLNCHYFFALKIYWLEYIIFYQLKITQDKLKNNSRLLLISDQVILMHAIQFEETTEYIYHSQKISLQGSRLAFVYLFHSNVEKCVFPLSVLSYLNISLLFRRIFGSNIIGCLAYACRHGHWWWT